MFQRCTVVNTCTSSRGLTWFIRLFFPHERVASGDETAKSEQKLEVGKARERGYHWGSVREYMLRNLLNIYWLYPSLSLVPRTLQDFVSQLWRKISFSPQL